MFLSKAKRVIKRVYWELTGSSKLIKRDIKIDAKWFGNLYGGFFVHPKLNQSSIVYSFGVGEDISFDLGLIEKYNCQVFAFDPTPKSINWIYDRSLPSNFHFFPYGIHSETGDVVFNLPKNKDFVSGSIIRQSNVDVSNSIKVHMKCLDDIILDLQHIEIDILKIDIEGSEYQVLDSILKSNVKINQILIEIHERFFKDGRKKTKELLLNLKDHGYFLFAISDTFEELSFIKCDQLSH